jgi:hypothetical protein
MKQGLFVMQSLPDVTLECPIEPWGKANEPDAEQDIGKTDSWHRTKVLGDIRKHTALKFPPKQQEQWSAIDLFHDLYPTSVSLPTSLPISLQPSGASQVWEMKFGTPCDWRANWKKLTLRFDRPHAKQLRGAAPADSTGSTHAPPAAAATQIPAAAPEVAPPRPEDAAERAALLNRATGGNVSHLARVRADKNQKRRLSTAALPAHAAEVKAGELYFIRTEPEVNEGELCVGLARALESSTDHTSRIKVKWFARLEWLKEARVCWSKTPSFRFAVNPLTGKVPYNSYEAGTDFLPIVPSLTPASQVPANKDKPRLTAEGVRALTEYCEQHGLRQEVGEQQGEESEMGEESAEGEESEEDVEESECEEGEESEEDL